MFRVEFFFVHFISFPELSYFQRKENLDVLLKILLVHCQHYQDKLPYRQVKFGNSLQNIDFISLSRLSKGMHEIAAVILHTINSEIEAVRDCVDASDLMKKIYDPNYIEHDTLYGTSRSMLLLFSFWNYLF